MKKVLIAFGTRPEAIKICPLIKELKGRSCFKTVVLITGQHKDMLDGVLNSFGVVPDYNLSVMLSCQSLFDVTSNILVKIKEVLEKEEPDTVVVHGDTATTFSAALAAFYLRIPITHIEAGLRTEDVFNPFPEEFYRRATAIVTKLHFAPTERAKANLLREGVSEDRIFVVGNTAIDALKTTVTGDYKNPLLDWAGKSRLVLLTAHRRESHGASMYSMFCAVKRVVGEFSDVKLIFPLHPNPEVGRVAKEVLGSEERIRLIPPLDVFDFHNILARCYLVLTDSGGVQEEAPSLGVPVLVMRESTERYEGVLAGTARLIGTGEEGVYSAFKELLENREARDKMAFANNPYGDGRASEKITDILEALL